MVSDEKLFRIAIAYFKNGKTQQDIASELGVSHVQVGKYLKLAKERGIVEIRINAPFVSNDEKKKYELYLRESFGLENLVLVPSASNEKQSFRFLVEGASDYLLSRYPNKPLNIGFGLGKTMNAICSFKPRTVDKRNLWCVYPVTNYSVSLDKANNRDSYFSVPDVVNDFSRNWGSKVDKPFMDRILSEEKIDVSTKWKNMDVIVGGVGIPISRDPEAREALLGREEAARCALVDIQGDYLNYFYDDSGNIVKSVTLSPNAMDVESMRRVGERIAVASGVQKIISIIGLWKCNIINTLVTDLDTARNMVEILR